MMQVDRDKIESIEERFESARSVAIGRMVKSGVNQCVLLVEDLYKAGQLRAKEFILCRDGKFGIRYRHFSFRYSDVEPVHDPLYQLAIMAYPDFRRIEKSVWKKEKVVETLKSRVSNIDKLQAVTAAYAEVGDLEDKYLLQNKDELMIGLIALVKASSKMLQSPRESSTSI